ncbi:MAG: 30S ribosomal protein S2 [Candidatus Dojkabacteria bacterium]|nr:30S ribosomal protein S2 [Candidatus Dojkabacteria bacterium]
MSKQNEIKEQTNSVVNLPYLESNEATIELLLKLGAHFGHQTQRWHPSMKEHIYTERNGIHIIDLVKTIDNFNKALDHLYEYAKRGEILFVSTKPQLRELVKNAAIKSKSHFVINRWPGGLLTNYQMSQKSVKKFNEMVSSFYQGIHNRTKKEMLKMVDHIRRLEFLYGGLRSFNKKFSCVVVIDPKLSKIAVKEASVSGIPVVAIADTNSPTTNINHIIPCNDDAIGPVEFLLERIADTILLGNQGKGVEYKPVNFDELTELANNMNKNLDKTDQAGQNKRVIRVTKEQVSKIVKQRKQK